MTFTGRSRTLTFSATFAGSVELTILDPQGDTDDQGFGSALTVSTGLGEVVAYFEATWDSTIGTIRQNTQAEIDIRFPWGAGSFFADGNQTLGNTTRAIGGGYTFTATVHEAFSVVVLPDNTSDGWPTYGGPPATDGTPGLGIVYYEVVKDGDPVTISMDFGSGYASSQTENAVGDWVIPAYSRYYDWRPSLFLDELDAITADWTITHGEPTDPTFSASDSWTNGAGSSSSVSWSADVLTLSQEVGGPDWTGVGDLVLGIVGPPTEYAVRARATGFGAGLGAAIPASLKRDSGPPLAISIPSGSDYTATHVQRDYDLTVRAGTNAGVTQTLRGRAPVQLWLQPPFGTDDDPLDWRCQALGTRWLSGTVSHAAATVIDDGSSTSGWAAGANTTVTSVGGAVRLTVAGGTGSATRTFAPEKVAEAYRSLRVRVRSNVGDDQPLTLSLEDGDPARTKSWSFQTGAAGTYVNVDIDLCRPQNETATTDGQSSRYPLTDVEGTGKPKESGPYWGVNRLKELTFGGLADGEQYEIDFLEFRRTLDPRLWVSPAFERFRDGWSAGGVATLIKSALYSHVEGRTSDVYAQARQGTAFVQTTVSSLWSRLTALGGWSVIEGAGSPDGYHNNDRDALYLGGSGATWSGSAWEDWHDKTVSGATQVYAAALWDSVQVYPDAGDVWTGTAPYGGTTPLRYSKRLRHPVHGIAFDVDAPFAGGAATWVRVSPVQIRGVATTAGDGTYQTASPWGFGARDHKAILSGFGSPSVLHVRPANRSRKRACFAVVAETAGGISYDVSPSGRHARAYPQVAGLTLGFAPNSPEPLVWSDRVTVLPSDRASVVWARRTRVETLFVANEEAGTVTVYSTTTEGESLDVVEAVAGTSPLLLALEDGGVTLYYRNPGGVVSYRRYSAEDPSGSGTTGLTCDDEGLGGYVKPASAAEPETTVILFVASGSVARSSSSNGAVFGGATVLAPGTSPFGSCSRDGIACEGWVQGGNATARFVGRQVGVIVGTATLKAAEAAALDWSSMGPGDQRAVLLTVTSGAVVSSVSRSLSSW